MSLKSFRSGFVSSFDLSLNRNSLVERAQISSYQYIHLGSKMDSPVTPSAGTAMMGGRKDLDDAFRWLCRKGMVATF